MSESCSRKKAYRASFLWPAGDRARWRKRILYGDCTGEIVAYVHKHWPAAMFIEIVEVD